MGVNVRQRASSKYRILNGLKIPCPVAIRKGKYTGFFAEQKQCVIGIIIQKIHASYRYRRLELSSVAQYTNDTGHNINICNIELIKGVNLLGKLDSCEGIYMRKYWNKLNLEFSLFYRSILIDFVFFFTFSCLFLVFETLGTRCRIKTYYKKNYLERDNVACLGKVRESLLIHSMFSQKSSYRR